MTTLRTIPAHEIVQRTYPRPPPEEKDRVAMAVGKAIDGCLTQFGYEFRQGRRPTATAMRAVAESLLDEGLEEAAVEIPPEEKEKILVQLNGVLQAYRRSEIFGLARPRTRVIVIDGRVGVYAQPDYWDGKARFFEMKSFLAIPPPPDVALQVRLFQLAFPQFEAVLLCINRHSQPVEVASTVIPFPTSEEAATALRLAYDLGVQFGVEKVFEYMQGPFVHYSLSTSPP
jgi:hypothetical protein